MADELRDRIERVAGHFDACAKESAGLLSMLNKGNADGLRRALRFIEEARALDSTPASDGGECPHIVTSDEPNPDALSLLAEPLDAYVDSCWQGSGSEPLATATWHNFLSTYEEADELIPKVRAFLAAAADPGAAE